MAVENPAIYTIGVYGSTEESFFGALVKHKIELCIDIRARRGMRGASYSYANSAALQAKLKERGIHYAHLKELSPTKEIRALQWQADKKEKTRKRERTGLSAAYIAAYKRDILNIYKRKPDKKFNAEAILAKAKLASQLPCDRPLKRIVLFCVEQHPDACHRSLVADALQTQLEADLRHIVL